MFRISPDGNFTNLYSFPGFNGGGLGPNAALVQGVDGNFYGTCLGGGPNNDGTVFRITPAGTFTNIWQFTGGTDGKWPQSGLVQGTDGNFYGTTPSGGSNARGTVYKITPDGTLTPLWQFGSLTNGADGSCPCGGGLVLGSDGNFYGTTATGGTNHVFGTVYKITSTGELTPLYQFGSLPNFADGFQAGAPLVQGIDGSFYGSTRFGGTNGNGGFGTLFKICVPLNPPANQISGLSVADSNIVVAVPSVAGETYQLQYREDLTLDDWSNIPDACVSNSPGALLTVTNFGGALAPQGFYRFDITP